jgi:hypothetical protein
METICGRVLMRCGFSFITRLVEFILYLCHQSTPYFRESAILNRMQYTEFDLKYMLKSSINTDSPIQEI